MRVFLGLGHVELRPARFRERLRERPGGLGRERHLDRQAILEGRHRHDERDRRHRAAARRRPVEAVEVRQGQRTGQLPRAVGAEIGMDDGVAIADEAVDAVDDRRYDELIGLATRVRLVDRGDSRLRMSPLAVDDRVVTALRPLPAGVAVHRPVAPADRTDPRVGMRGRQPSLEVGDEPQRRGRRRIAAVEQRLDPHVPDALTGSERHERDEMAIVGMDATGTDQADDVEPPVVACGPPAGFEERGALGEAAIRDRGVDPREILQDGFPRTEVEVTDLRVAHLSGRQADRALGCTQDRVRPALEEPAPDWHVGRADRVDRRVMPDAEPVEHDEDDRPRTGSVLGGQRAHCAAPRARAVIPARATIPAISSGLSDAPPTSAPSMAGSEKNSSMFAEVTLPP